MSSISSHLQHFIGLGNGRAEELAGFWRTWAAGSQVCFKQLLIPSGSSEWAKYWISESVKCRPTLDLVPVSVCSRPVRALWPRRLKRIGSGSFGLWLRVLIVTDPRGLLLRSASPEHQYLSLPHSYNIPQTLQFPRRQKTCCILRHWSSRRQIPPRDTVTVHVNVENASDLWEVP